MCSVCRESSELVKGFLRATAKGFHFATEHPEEAAKLFFDQASQHLQGAGPSAELQWEQVKASQPYVSKVCRLDWTNSNSLYAANGPFIL